MDKEIEQAKKGPGTLFSYAAGFVLSLIFTAAAYMVVQVHVSSGHEAISHSALLAAIMCLAIAQLIVQLVFFLHLGGSGRDSRARLFMFISTVALVLLVVLASLWIMDHLNYNMTSAQVQQYMKDQQGGF